MFNKKKGKEVINQMIVDDLGLTKSLMTIYGDDVKKYCHHVTDYITADHLQLNIVVSVFTLTR